MTLSRSPGWRRRRGQGQRRAREHRSADSGQGAREAGGGGEEESLNPAYSNTRAARQRANMRAHVHTRPVHMIVRVVYSRVLFASYCVRRGRSRRRPTDGRGPRRRLIIPVGGVRGGPGA